MTKYTIDRFEGNKAVLLLRKDESVQMDVPRNQLPEEVVEGDILEMVFDSDMNIVKVNILVEETKSARKQASDLLKKIIEKNKE